MSKYKVGDKVRVKELGNCTCCTPNMAKMSGKILTIESVVFGDTGYTVKQNCYVWSDDMLENVEKEEFTFYVDNTYKGWEILKMIDEEVLKKGDGYKRLNSIYSLNKFTVGDGGYPSINSLLSDKFVLVKKEYMTFLEAKEKGIPKHKDYEYEITINRKDGMIAFIQDLDKKVWTIEGEE